ncbi:HAD-IIB family hydrolase [Candidatus Microgenomates bacterium]|nr:MAG: HAD-IIB family hydrolase [Candidatus Microgenomates bacterium]
MLKAIVLDVDGVIVGKRKGFNFPNPHGEVLEFLKKIRLKGIPVILCTAKFSFAIEEIIKKSGLKNPHIAERGALIYDLLEKKVIKSSPLLKELAKQIILSAIENNIFVEAFTQKDYFIHKGQNEEILKKRVAILQTNPKIIDFNSDIFFPKSILKILFTARDENDKKAIEKISSSFKDKIETFWTMHPSSLPLEYFSIAAVGVSKGEALKEVAQNLNISLDNVLAVGDTLGDWEFMKVCKYVGTLENAEEELKKMVKLKGENSFIGPSVDNHGIIKIINHFVK